MVWEYATLEISAVVVAPHVVETRFVLRRPAGPAAGSGTAAQTGQDS